MTSRRRISWILGALLATCLLSGLVHAEISERGRQIGDQLMCMCNCNQILTQCNHVGCTVSASMLKSLDQRVQTNSSDDLVIQSFVQEFGEKVLALPPAQGFNLLAWMIPGFAFAAGLALVIVVIRHWRRSGELATAGGPPVSADMLDRVRKQIDDETEE